VGGEMKLEKNDRIISNADYERLVALAELHESAIAEMVTNTIMTELIIIHRHIAVAQKALIDNIEFSTNWQNTIKRQDYLLERKNEIIQEKNTEIARLQKKYWWKLF
jgi:hypothetical protein